MRVFSSEADQCEWSASPPLYRWLKYHLETAARPPIVKASRSDSGTLGGVAGHSVAVQELIRRSQVVGQCILRDSSRMEDERPTDAASRRVAGFLPFSPAAVRDSSCFGFRPT